MTFKAFWSQPFQELNSKFLAILSCSYYICSFEMPFITFILCCFPYLKRPFPSGQLANSWLTSKVQFNCPILSETFPYLLLSSYILKLFSILRYPLSYRNCRITRNVKIYLKVSRLDSRLNSKGAGPLGCIQRTN